MSLLSDGGTKQMPEQIFKEAMQGQTVTLLLRRVLITASLARAHQGHYGMNAEYPQIHTLEFNAQR
jgi:hypothetical protein